MGLVGVVPAAGRAKRLGLLPSSKELFPIGFEKDTDGLSYRPKPVATYLLDRMISAGVERIVVVVSREKCDLIRYFGGQYRNVPIAFIINDMSTGGMPVSLNLARPWLADDTVLFGMPDTIFYPEDVFVRLVSHHRHIMADVTLALFPTQQPEKFGMVAFDGNRRLVHTVDKPTTSSLEFMWGAGCWGQRFSDIMFDELCNAVDPRQEVVLGDLFQAANQRRANVSVLPFHDGEYLDVGTLDDLKQAVSRYSTLETAKHET
jgi:glucose-1-phosphate thymidylyltransferase